MNISLSEDRYAELMRKEAVHDVYKTMLLQEEKEGLYHTKTERLLFGIEKVACDEDDDNF